MPVFTINVNVRDERGLPDLIRKGFKIMSERLSREIQETRDAVTALTGRYQVKIDAQVVQIGDMQTQIDALKEALANGDTTAADAAADALDQLQTDMAALAAEPVAVPEPPVEPAPEPEPAA